MAETAETQGDEDRLPLFIPAESRPDVLDHPIRLAWDAALLIEEWASSTATEPAPATQGLSCS